MESGTTGAAYCSGQDFAHAILSQRRTDTPVTVPTPGPSVVIRPSSPLALTDQQTALVALSHVLAAHKPPSLDVSLRKSGQSSNAIWSLLSAPPKRFKTVNCRINLALWSAEHLPASSSNDVRILLGHGFQQRRHAIDKVREKILIATLCWRSVRPIKIAVVYK